MTLRDELLGVLAASGVALPADLDDQTSLIQSGILDSTALFDVALWIEQRVGGSLDVAAFDLVEEWDTLSRLLAFVERHGGTGGPRSP